jgi:hypothetical protein
MGLLAKRGPAAHKDMCYGLHLISIDENETLAFSSLPGKGELYCIVKILSIIQPSFPSSLMVNAVK